MPARPPRPPRSPRPPARRVAGKTGLGKKEQSEQTRARILDAAITLFAKRGFASTSTHELARAIGMTPGALYWHFADKEALLVAALDELRRRMFVVLARAEERAGAQSAADAIGVLVARVARVVVEAQENLLLVGVIGAEATETNPRIEQALRESYAGIASVLRGLLRRAAAEGVDVGDDIECTAEMFLGLYMGAILHQRLFRADFPLERALPVVERMLLRAILPA